MQRRARRRPVEVEAATVEEGAEEEDEAKLAAAGGTYFTPRD